MGGEIHLDRNGQQRRILFVMMSFSANRRYLVDINSNFYVISPCNPVLVRIILLSITVRVQLCSTRTSIVTNKVKPHEAYVLVQLCSTTVRDRCSTCLRYRTYSYYCRAKSCKSTVEPSGPEARARVLVHVLYEFRDY